MTDADPPPADGPGPPRGPEPGFVVPDTAHDVEGFSALGFFPADHVAVESGKLYVQGGYWTVLRFQSFPSALPSLGLAAVIRTPFHAAHADHTFKMGLQDSERRSLSLNVQGEFRVAPGIESRYGESGVMPVAVPIAGLQFERPDDYSFYLEVDGNELARYHFRVIQVAWMGPQPHQPA